MMRVTKERRSRVSLVAEFSSRLIILSWGVVFALICCIFSLNEGPIDSSLRTIRVLSPTLHQLEAGKKLPIPTFKTITHLKPKRGQNPNDGAFVHIGKTGGSTISLLLRNGCHSFMPHPCRANLKHESMTSKLVESYYHVPDFGLLRESNHTFYIITSRDPFDRTVSAFVYDHIQNRIARNETISEIKLSKYKEAYRCFSSLQQFVEHLGDKPHEFKYPHKRNWVSAESCSDLAKAALHSRVKIYNHLYFSMFLILTFTPMLEKQTLFTIRQEYLWDDWKSLNHALGQTDTVYLPNDGMDRLRNVTLLENGNIMPITRELTQGGRLLLCNALREEYRAYYYLLTNAKNLSPNDVEQSMIRTKKNCPNLNLPYSTFIK